MKTGKTLMELAAEVQRQAEAKRDFVSASASLKYLGDKDAIEVEGFGHFGVNEHAHNQLGAHLGIPAKYYDKMRESAPALLEANVNYWLRSNDDRRMVRTLDGEVRAVLSDKYRPLDNLDLLETVLPVLGQQEMEVISSEVTEKRLYLKVLTPKVTFEIKKGDVVQAGLVISNSEVGAGSLSVEPLLYRLVCTNGMIANDSKMRKYHVGRGNSAFGEGAAEFFRDETRALDDRAFWAKVRDLVGAAVSQINFQRIAERFFEVEKNIIEADPVRVVEVFAKQNTLNQSEKKIQRNSSEVVEQFFATLLENERIDAEQKAKEAKENNESRS